MALLKRVKVELLESIVDNFPTVKLNWSEELGIELLKILEQMNEAEKMSENSKRMSDFLSLVLVDLSTQCTEQKKIAGLVEHLVVPMLCVKLYNDNHFPFNFPLILTTITNDVTISFQLVFL
jgi:hypothetical protein